MKRPRSHQAGDIAENAVAGAFLRNGWIVNPCTSDYGYDFMIHRIVDGAGTSIFSLLQVKGTEQNLKSNANGEFPFVFETDHLSLWARTPLPVYVCVVKFPSTEIFVFDAKDAISALYERHGGDWEKAKSRSVNISEQSILNERRAQEIENEVRNYWTHLLNVWGTAAAAASMGKALYVNWLSGYHALASVVAIQHELKDILGGKSALDEFLAKAGLAPLRMP